RIKNKNFLCVCFICFCKSIKLICTNSSEVPLFCPRSLYVIADPHVLGSVASLVQLTKTMSTAMLQSVPAYSSDDVSETDSLASPVIKKKKKWTAQTYDLRVKFTGKEAAE